MSRGPQRQPNKTSSSLSTEADDLEMRSYLWRPGAKVCWIVWCTMCGIVLPGVGSSSGRSAHALKLRGGSHAVYEVPATKEDMSALRRGCSQGLPVGSLAASVWRTLHWPSPTDAQLPHTHQQHRIADKGSELSAHNPTRWPGRLMSPCSACIATKS